MGRVKGGHGWDWASGEEHLKRAIELNPNYEAAYSSYANQLSRQGRLNEAIAEMKKALALDPVGIRTNVHLGELLIYNRQYDEAIEQLQKTLELRADSSAPIFLIRAYWHNGMYEEAIAQAEKSVSLGGNQTQPVFLRQVASGNRAEAMRTLENWEGLGPFGRAFYYAMLGENDLVIEWLTKAVDERYHMAENCLSTIASTTKL